jgi:hypothetical protein
MENPFMVQEWIRRGITKARTEALPILVTDEQKSSAEEAIKGMERSLRSLDGICVLHLDQMHERALRRISWWKFKERRDFALNEWDWKQETRKRLVEEAKAVEDFEL